MARTDASIRHWFGEDRPKARLPRIIDDAAGIAFAKFRDADRALADMDCLKNWFEFHGLPPAACADRASHFRANPTRPSPTGALATATGPFPRPTRRSLRP
ncbi:MAG: hypothetical protein LBP95_01545 [Deltaproteobacteria bacterium]|nr:hypothetical protein [Deltaproteobacteria bacterium]